MFESLHMISRVRITTGIKAVMFSLALLLLSITVYSCTKEDNCGYPKSVTLLATGESKIISGEKGHVWLHLDDPYNLTIIEEVDSIYIEKDWLTIKLHFPDNHFELIAEPNPTKKNRAISIDLTIGDAFGYMTVKQNGNPAASK